MPIPRLAAVAVTAVVALLTFGLVLDSYQSGEVRIIAFVLFAAGAYAAVGLALGKPWGKAAVVLVGIVNIALILLAKQDIIDESYVSLDGYWGIAASGVAILLGAVA